MGIRTGSAGDHVVGGLSLQTSVSTVRSFIFPSNLHRKQHTSLFSCVLKFYVVLSKLYDITLI